MLEQTTILLTAERRPSDPQAVSGNLGREQEVRELHVVDGTRVFAGVTVGDQPRLERFPEGWRGPSGPTRTTTGPTMTAEEVTMAMRHDLQDVVV